MDEQKLERDTVKFQDQMNSSTFCKYTRLPQIAIYLFHGRKEAWKRYPQISRSPEFFYMLSINKIATDCYVCISWKKRSLKAVPSNVKINWISPHFENKWDCHRLLFIYLMAEKTLERGTLTFRDQLTSSTFEISEVATYCYLFISWKKTSLKEVASNFKINWVLPHFENKWDCHRLLFIYVMEEKKLERGTLKCQHWILPHAKNKWDCHRLRFICCMKEKKLERGTVTFQNQLIFHILNINEIATDCSLCISWKKSYLKEVPSNFKINRILPHLERKWDCHRLLFLDSMEDLELERGPPTFQDQLKPSTFWK